MIEINNLTTNSIDEEFLKRITQEVLEREHPPVGRIPEESNLSIVLVGQGKIRALNKRYLGKNRATDVLAFGENSKLKTIGELGEIVICLREVNKNAKRLGCAFEAELARVLIHGILHLLGYDHEVSPEKAREMEEKQSHYLSQVKF